MELAKNQLKTALKDVNSIYQNCYNTYCFTGNCGNRTEIEGMTVLLNTVPDSIEVIKQLLMEKLETME